MNPVAAERNHTQGQRRFSSAAPRAAGGGSALSARTARFQSVVGPPQSEPRFNRPADLSIAGTAAQQLSYGLSTEDPYVVSLSNTAAPTESMQLHELVLPVDGTRALSLATGVYDSTGLKVPRPPSTATPRHAGAGGSVVGYGGGASQRRMSVAEKAFGSQHQLSLGLPPTPRKNVAFHVGDDNLSIHSNERTPQQLEEAPTPRKLDAKELFLPVPVRLHPPRRRTVLEESITRTRRPQTAPKPAFGTTEYVRHGLPTPAERQERDRVRRFTAYLKEKGLPQSVEAVEEARFDPEPEEPVDVLLRTFEARLKALEAEKAAEEEAEAQRIKQQQVTPPANGPIRRASMSPAALAFSPMLATAPGGDYRDGATPVPTLATREYRLLKLLFRRAMLQKNALFARLQTLGEQETVRRIQSLNRKGGSRLHPDDFYYLMTDVLANTQPQTSRRTTTVALPVSSSGGSGAGRTKMGVGSSVNSTQSPGEETLPPVSARSASQRNHDEADNHRHLTSHGPHPQLDLTRELELRIPEATAVRTLLDSEVLRMDSDLLFAACDLRMVGVIDDDDLIQAMKILFRPNDVLIAVHCKRIVDGGCTVSQTVSLHEAQLMLKAVAAIGRSRYGPSIEKDVGVVVEMLREVESGGYVPQVCFRNFIVHGPTLSRALEEMSEIAELPGEPIRLPSPDPDRDVRLVHDLLKNSERDSRRTATPTLSPRNSIAPNNSDRAADLASSATLTISVEPQPNSKPQRDLTNPRLRADQYAVAHRKLEEVPEHDAPHWFSADGFVWMSSNRHGPQVIV